MGELTRQDVEDAFKVVLNSPEFTAQLELAVMRITDSRNDEWFKGKMLLTFGIDCKDPDEINATRVDMRFLRKTREFSEGEMAKLFRWAFSGAVIALLAYGVFLKDFFKSVAK